MAIKNSLLLLLLLAAAHSIFAQGIGIGQSQPHASAQLDISSNNRGLLIPRLTTAQRTAINAPAAGLLVYDSTLQDLMYFQNGWKSTSALKLPFSGTYSTAGPLLEIGNTGSGTIFFASSASGTAMRAFSNQSIGIWGQTENGYGGYFSSNAANGIALGVAGKIQVNGSTGAAGSIMAVNNAGNASWMPAVAFSVGSSVSGGQNIAHNTDVAVNFTNTDYNIGADYNISTNTFTAPANGIYHFDAMLMWENPASSTGYLAITLRVNNSNYATVRTPAVSGRTASNTLSIDIDLNTFDQVSIFAFQTTGATLAVFPSTLVNKFTGRLVMPR
jgi:hypothetical protein